MGPPQQQAVQTPHFQPRGQSQGPPNQQGGPGGSQQGPPQSQGQQPPRGGPGGADTQAPPSLGHNGPPAPQQQPQPPQGPPAHQGPPSGTSTLTRERKRIAIIDPTTRQEVSVDGTSADKKVTIPPPSTSPGSKDSGSNGPKEGKKGESKPSNNIAASFAAQVAKAAGTGEGASSPAPIPSSSKSVEEEIIASPKEQVAEQQPVVKHLVEQEKQAVKAEQKQKEASAVPMKQVQETLSVTTELGIRGEEPLYEPVSPTPLPDSPCDEAKPAAAVEEKVVDCSPFVEVINKKAGA